MLGRMVTCEVGPALAFRVLTRQFQSLIERYHRRCLQRTSCYELIVARTLRARAYQLKRSRPFYI